MNPKTYATARIVWSVLWALSLIATAFVFKGNHDAIWLQGGVNVWAYSCFSCSIHGAGPASGSSALPSVRGMACFDAPLLKA